MKTIYEWIKEYEDAIDSLKKQRDAKPERVAGWMPKVGEDYHFINSLGEIENRSWNDDGKDLWRLSQNNVFRSEEDALAYRKISLRAQELIEQGDRIDWEDTAQDKWCFVYDYEDKEIDVDCNRFMQRQGTTYFLTPEFDKIKDEFDEDTIKLFVGLR